MRSARRVPEQTELFDDRRAWSRGRFLLLAGPAHSLVLILPLLFGRSCADLPRRLAAVNEVEYADHLVGRQAAEECQTNVAMSLERAEHERDDEHLLVVADVAVVVIPGAKADIEPGVLLDQLAMYRPDELQLAMRRRQ